MNLENLNVTELNAQEKVSLDGGIDDRSWIAYIVGAIGGVLAGIIAETGYNLLHDNGTGSVQDFYFNSGGLKY